LDIREKLACVKLSLLIFGQALLLSLDPRPFLGGELGMAKELE
jgi:hypothetical protein